MGDDFPGEEARERFRRLIRHAAPPAPRHPGVVLREEYLEPFDISQNALAKAMGVPPRRINEIVLGRRAITAATAVLLEEALGASAEQWMHLQALWDIDQVTKQGGPKRWREPVFTLKVAYEDFPQALDYGLTGSPDGRRYRRVG